MYVLFSSSESLHRREQTGTVKQTLLCAVGGASSSRNGASKQQLVIFWTDLFSKVGTAGGYPELDCAIAKEADHNRGQGEAIMHISTSSSRSPGL